MRRTGEGGMWPKWQAACLCALLLAVAVVMMVQRAWPAGGQEFLLVLFACTALMLDWEGWAGPV